MTLTVTKSRLAGLDVLRGINIAAMIIYHFCLVYYPNPITLPTTLIHFVGSLVGRLFLFLAGVGTWFFFRKRPSITLLKRGIFLFLLTALINFFIEGDYYIDWNIIQDIGFCFIIMALLAYFSLRYKFWLALVIYLVCFGLFVQFDFKLEGVFPIFPLAIYFLIGYSTAWLCSISPSKPIVAKPPILVPTVSLGMMVLGFLVNIWTSGNRFEWCALTLAHNGGFIGLYFLFVYLWGHWSYQGFSGRFLVLLGTTSLTSYYIQQALMVFLRTIGFQVIVISRFISYILLTIIIFVVIYVIINVWKRFKFVGTLEWWMRRL